MASEIVVSAEYRKDVDIIQVQSVLGHYNTPHATLSDVADAPASHLMVAAAPVADDVRVRFALSLRLMTSPFSQSYPLHVP